MLVSLPYCDILLSFYLFEQVKCLPELFKSPELVLLSLFLMLHLLAVNCDFFCSVQDF